jgi:hypothetical protein
MTRSGHRSQTAARVAQSTLVRTNPSRRRRAPADFAAARDKSRHPVLLWQLEHPISFFIGHCRLGGALILHEGVVSSGPFTGVKPRRALHYFCSSAAKWSCYEF